MIKGTGITKKFGSFKVLDDANINVPKGSVYGLIGPNGAGKTTIIKHLVGVLKQDEGEILLDGDSIYENADTKAKFAYISDDVFFFHSSTLKSLKEFYMQCYEKFDLELYERALECFPEIKENKTLRTMSKGMQKQAAFILAISTKPEILIMDEPLDGLDPVMRRQVWSTILAEVAEREMTVLVSSHNLRELEDVCDYVGVMHHGKVVLEKDLSELQNDIHKIQVAFEGESPDYAPGYDKDGVKVMYHSGTGRVNTWIIRGTYEDVEKLMNKSNPIFIDIIPLSLEEIFIYEMGGEDYAITEILM